MSKFKEIVDGLESVFARPLTDEERDQVALWDKCRELENFVSNFPREWNIFKETLQSYAGDYTDAWETIKSTPPHKVEFDLTVLHGQVQAVTRVIDAFVADVERAPEAARHVPDVIKEAFIQLQAMPKDAVRSKSSS